MVAPGAWRQAVETNEGTEHMQNTNQGAQPRSTSRLKRGLVAIGIIAAVTIAGIAVSACGGGDDGDKATPTKAATKTKVATTPTPGNNLGSKTPIAFSEGDFLTAEDLASRGSGEPGRGEFTGTRLIIPSIEVNAEFTQKVVGTDGQMPDPNGPEDVAWYDFSQWPGLGGIPDKGGNIVMAGHVDYINYGPAVFWRIDELKAGDQVQIQLVDGTMATYEIEFNKVVEPGDQDWSNLVAGTADESVTLITCTGAFEAGHYDKRQIAWGRRVA
jgi:LPXTG-site transpeptidase (sortase) family protein